MGGRQFRPFFDRDHQISLRDVHIDNDIRSNVDRAVSSYDDSDD